MSCSFFDRLKHKLLKLRYRPLRVFVFHHVSDVRDSLICEEGDWTQTEQFMHNIQSLQKKYKFISLSQAIAMLKNDKFRFTDYAVLTTDDGFASVSNLIPWLEEMHIPLTLFINSRYMKGDIIKPAHEKRLLNCINNVDIKSLAKRMYLNETQIWSFLSPNIEIGLHGHEHVDARTISEQSFEKDFLQCLEKLQSHPRYIPAYAYPWGRDTLSSITFLQENGIVPVLVDGGENCIWEGYISRDCIDNKKL